MRKLILSSFGFKYGIPQDADYVFDVRFLPNPFYVEELKLLSGVDEPVREYVRSSGEAEAFLDSSVLFLNFVIPRYLRTCKETLHVAVGCTGGRHRSVALAEWICERYKSASAGIERDIEVLLRHRDVGKAPQA